MSHIVYIAIAAIVGVVIGSIAGPTLRIFLLQIGTEVKAEYEKEKAAIIAKYEADKAALIVKYEADKTVVVADAEKAKADLVELKVGATAQIASLKADLAAAEAKIEGFRSLFASVTAPSAAATVVSNPVAPTA